MSVQGSRRIAVVGGTGLVGKVVVGHLRELGHDAFSVDRSAGIDVATGVGLADALAGVDAVIDTCNTGEIEQAAVVAFFGAAARNIGEAAVAAGVRHVVLLSIIGVEADHRYPHFAGKAAQEQALADSGAPWTVVRATQFFEFAEMATTWGDKGTHSDVPPLLMQPLSVLDTARTLADVALGEPHSGVVEVAGPERIDLVDAARRTLAARGRDKELVPSWRESGFGTGMAGELLLPGPAARIGADTFDDWLAAVRAESAG